SYLSSIYCLLRYRLHLQLSQYLLPIGIGAVADIGEDPAVGAVVEDSAAVFARIRRAAGVGGAAGGAVGGRDPFADVGDAAGFARQSEEGMEEHFIPSDARRSAGHREILLPIPADFDDGAIHRGAEHHAFKLH